MDERAEYIQLYDNPDMYDQWDIGPFHPRSVFMRTFVYGPNVLELGCGGSGFTRQLNRMAGIEKIVSVDINPKWIRLGRQRLPNVQYIHGMIEDLDIQERFDTVILMEVLEHVLNPAEVLDTAITHLKDNGLILITVPVAGGQYDFVDNHKRQYTKESMGELLDEILLGRYADYDCYVEGEFLYVIIRIGKE